MGLFDIFSIGKIKKENEHLKITLAELKAEEVLDIKKVVEKHNAQVTTLKDQVAQLEGRVRELDSEVTARKAQIIVLDDEILLESFALYKPHYKLNSSAAYKAKLDEIREKQKAMVRNGHAVTAQEAWTVNNSKSEGKKMVSDMKKLLLRSFNNECDYCVDNVRFNNIEASENRIEKSFDACSKLGRIMSARISEEYKSLKYEELRLAFEYAQKKQEEKEEQRRLREELREQQKLEQEIRAAREKIAKERKHFSKAIADLEARLAGASDSAEKQALSEKLKELNGSMAELEKEERMVDYREKNAKAGYVYVISNIGSFGENVYKIGMTRRLDPMDRVDELGDASVPFYFDVHAMIFSENAPELESKLHAQFHSARLNKVNNRREFFRAKLSEIETVIREHHDNTFELTREHPAEQYRESLQST
jgi:TolA-binding protein